MTPAEALAIVERCARDEEIDGLLIDLLRHPSPQTDRLEADPQIKNFIAACVAPRIAELTGNPGTIDAMGNLIWRSCRTGERGLLLMGYAMTFPAGSMAEPFSGAVIDGAPFGYSSLCAAGRGACEQKGALAAMIYAAAIVARAGSDLHAPLILAVSLAGETGRHDAAEFMLAQDALPARCGIVGLGTCNRICLGNKGRIDIELVIRGRSAHSSMPEQGSNAVDGFRRVMDRLDGLPLGRPHEFLGRATLSVTQVRSAPDLSHTIPDLCRALLDRRLLPGEDPEAALRAIENAVAEVGGWSVEVGSGAFMYPSEVRRDCRIAAAVASASRARHGEAADVFYSPAALDAGCLNRHGIEAIMFGPGDLRFAHTDQDVVSLQEVRDAAKIYAATALQMLR
jgi:acetylornithine deacetylase